MIEYYSHKIQNVIQKELFKAQRSIKIAVAWFTNDLLFQPLILKLQSGVSVEMILNKDDINDSNSNEIDFPSFLDVGGVLHWNATNKLMHDKFCIIDDSIVIYGSYNWTNRAEFNEESIAVSKEEENTLTFYKDLFDKLCKTYPAEKSSKEINFNKYNPFDFDNGELILDKCSLLIYRWIIEEKYIYRIFSKETKRQICLYDFEDVAIHSNPDVYIIGVKRAGAWYFYSMKDRYMNEIQYVQINPIQNDTRFWICKAKWGIANEIGIEILPCEYDNLTVYNNTEYVVSKKNSSYIIINSKNNEIYPWEFDDIEMIDKNRFLISLGSRKGVLDKLIEVVPPLYDEVKPIQDNFYIVREGNCLGLAAPSCIKLNCKYEEISYLGTNKFLIKENGKYGLYTNDEIKIPCEYDELNPDAYSVSFKKGKAGVISEKGEVLVEPKYTEIGHFKFHDSSNTSLFYLAYKKPFYTIWIDGKERGKTNEDNYSLQDTIESFSLFYPNEDPFLEGIRHAFIRTIFESIVSPMAYTHIVRISSENKYNEKQRLFNKFYLIFGKVRTNRRLDCQQEWPLAEELYPFEPYSEGDIIYISKSALVIEDIKDGHENCYVIAKVNSPLSNKVYYIPFNPLEIKRRFFPIKDDSRYKNHFHNGTAVSLCRTVDNAQEMFDLLTRNRTKDCAIKISKVNYINEGFRKYIYTFDILP